jgi:signal peptide peptidase SppA
MRLIDIINAPWAITPEMLEEIQAIYGRHLRGEKIDLQGLEARLGQPLNNEPKGYEVIDGVAVLPIEGVIAKRANLFTRISGGTSSQLVIRDFMAAMADPKVEAVVKAYDSPGGSVDGTPEMAETFFRMRGVKPILSFTDGMMSSAAYWGGAAADRVLISSEVTQVGSIGVIGKHIDMSQAEARDGKKTTLIYAGRFKAVGNPHEPLSEEGRSILQASIDHAFSVFVGDVARFRGTSAEDVLERMATGRSFDGSKAIEAGLVDGVATFAETLDMARDMARTRKKTSLTGVVRATNDKGANAMTIEKLKAEHPELVQAIVAGAQTGMAEAVATARAEGATAENQRIADVRAQSIPGHEALIEQLAFDGKSTGAEAALAIVQAEKGLRQQAAATIAAEAGRVVPPAEDEGDTAKTMKRAAFNVLSQSEQRAAVAGNIKIVD